MPYADGVEQILHALRALVGADQDMRRRISAGMDMNLTDLQALRWVIRAERRGDLATPREMATYLGITTASTTKLLDRLTASGHLERAPHPTDRRSLVLRPTVHAHEEIGERLRHMHERMSAIAAAVPTEARAAVVEFLRAMAAEFSAVESLPPLTPAETERGR
jgi:DNA-binding MarR family transcriptional regulator